jgi:hypothetical protein
MPSEQTGGCTNGLVGYFRGRINVVADVRLALVAVATATAGGIMILSSSAPTRATNLNAPIVAAASERNDALETFTFHANISMAMRHFPWLHFHMEGLGDYRRGDHYVLRLTGAPSFASRMRQIDLSMIDPGMWPNRYRYTEVGRRDGDTLLPYKTCATHRSSPPP